MKEFKIKENIIIILLALLILGGLGYRAYQAWHVPDREKFEIAKSTEEDYRKEDEKDENEEKVKDIVVHVAGGVKSSGVYNLREGSRVFDAVEAAGGFKEDAVEDAVNLAAGLYDGQQVYIPIEGEEHLPAGVADPGYTQKININTASQKDLETLPGIGSVKAQAIMQDRETSGPFKSVEEVTRVTGIGEKTLESIRDLVTI